MRLDSIHIKNFRLLADVSFSLSALIHPVHLQLSVLKTDLGRHPCSTHSVGQCMVIEAYLKE